MASIMFAFACSDVIEIEEPEGPQGKQGEPGKDGKSIYYYGLDTESMPGYTLVIFWNGDDEYYPVPILNGKDGEPGLSAYQLWILWMLQNNPNECVTYECYQEFNKGDPGKDGLNVYEIWKLTLTESDCDTWECFMEAIKGENGLNGRDGLDGLNGVDGKDGIDGLNGRDGLDGINGLNSYELWLKMLPFDYRGCTTIDCFFEIYRGYPGMDGLDGKDAEFDFGYEYDDDGNVILIINGTRITVPKGTDGINGINGENGKNGTSINITCIKKYDTYTLIKFSDGSHVEIPHGIDGKDGLNGENGETFLLYVMDNLIVAFYQWVSDTNANKLLGGFNRPSNCQTFDCFLWYCKNISNLYLITDFE